MINIIDPRFDKNKSDNDHINLDDNYPKSKISFKNELENDAILEDNRIDMKLDTNSIPKLYNQQQSIAYSRYFDFLCIRQLLNSEQYENVENEESEYENSRFGINMEDVEERIKEHIEETAKQFRSNIGEK